MANGADTVVQIGGPWQHRSVSANGTRFHAAEAGDGPLVLLLHGFPEFWWTWRHQLAVLPEAGFRAVAVDRSEEHTSELQSHVNLVCRLLLEKKKYDRASLTLRY